MTRWNRFWFSPTPPRLLGIGRAVFCGAVLLDSLGQSQAVWADQSPVFFTPVSTLRFLGPPNLMVVQGLETLWRLTLLASTLGLFTRCSVLLAALLSTYMFGLPMLFSLGGSSADHHSQPVVLILWILALARCGDAFSLDTYRNKQPSRPSAAYTWPIRMIWIVLSLVFFEAGISKLRLSGSSWFTSETLAFAMLRRFYCEGSAPSVDWGLALCQNLKTCRCLAFLFLLNELLYPLALLTAFGRRWLLVFPAAMVFGMVWVRLLLGPNFWLLMVAHVFWLPQDSLPEGAEPGPRPWPVYPMLALVLAGSLFDLATLREDFPFSGYPMFARVNTQTRLTRCVLYGLSNGVERPLQMELRSPEPEGNPTLNRLRLHGAFSHLRERPDDLQEGLRDCLRRYRALGQPLAGVRLYECRWELNPDLRGRDTPERTLIAEVNQPN